MSKLIVTIEDTHTGRDLKVTTDLDREDEEILAELPTNGKTYFDFVLNLIGDQVSIETRVV